MVIKKNGAKSFSFTVPGRKRILQELVEDMRVKLYLVFIRTDIFTMGRSTFSLITIIVSTLETYLTLFPLY